MYVLYSAKRQPLISLLSKRGSRLLLVRLNVGARTDDVWSRGFLRPKGKNFLKKIEIFLLSLAQVPVTSAKQSVQ